MKDTNGLHVALVAAVAADGVIGCQGRIPWPRLRRDMQYFRRVTLGHPVVMGRKTYESLPGVLPGRTNIILSRDTQRTLPAGVLVSSFETAIKFVRNNLNQKRLFVIGGGEIYRTALDFAHEIFLTKVEGSFEGDTFFPELDQAKWRLAWEEFHPADPDTPLDCGFYRYVHRERSVP